MLKSTQREIALSAARSYLREQGIDPLACEADDIFAALDDLARLDHDLIAVQWYTKMSQNQEQLMRRDFNKWRHNWAVVNRLSRSAMKRLNCKDPDFDAVLTDLDAMTTHLEQS